MSILQKILGDMYVAGTRGMFLKDENRSNSVSPELVKLIGARVCVLSESGKKQKLNDILIKNLTGNDTITARSLYCEPVQFIPTCKPILLTNNKPTFNTDDQAILDRLRYIPFNARFEDNPKEGELKRDPELAKKMENEYLSEVFSWIVKGSILFYKDGGKIIPPENIINATNDYVNEIDSIGQFIENMCEIGEKYKIKKTVIYQRYLDWCNDNDIDVSTKDDFYGALIRRKFEVGKYAGIFHFYGIQILQKSEITENENIDDNTIFKDKFD